MTNLALFNIIFISSIYKVFRFEKTEKWSRLLFKILFEKLKEAVIAVLPITVMVVILNFVTTPMPTLNLLAFTFGALF